MGKNKKKGGTSAGGKRKDRNPQSRIPSENPDSLEQSLQKRSRFSTEHLRQLEELYREGLNLEDEILAEEDLSEEELQNALDELETTRDVRSAAEYLSEAEVSAESREDNGTAELFRPGTGSHAGEQFEAEENETAAKTGREEENLQKTTEPVAAEEEKKTAVPFSETGESTGASKPTEEGEEKKGTTESVAETGEERSVTESSAETEEENKPEEFALQTGEEKKLTDFVAETGEEKAVIESAAETGKEEEEAESVPETEEKEDGIALEKLTSAGITLGELAEAGITAGEYAPEEAASDKQKTGEWTEEESASEEVELDKTVSEELTSEIFPSEESNSEILTSEELARLLEEETEKTFPAKEENPSVTDEPEDSADTDEGPEGSGKSGLPKKARLIQITVFFVALFGISIVGLCMPLRPTESQIEKRTLTEFPEFTWESFLSGDYTDQISTWYADTFPFRETLLSWYTDFKKLFGIQGDEVYIGDVIVADDIPDIPDEDETTAVATVTDASGTDADEVATQETTTEAPTETTTEAPTETTTEEQTETTTEEATEAQTSTTGGSDSSVAGEQIGSVYIYGDQAFSVYGFSLEMSDNYAKMISLAAEELAGKATVYNILVPLSYGIQLDSDLWESMGWSDEEKAIKYMYSQMSDEVKTVSVYQALLAHKDEYIYFRTDHHWTALGAYYAYQCFADVKGITANALDSFETMTFENYLGSLYSQSNESEALANNPDTITAYVPHGTNKMTITQKDGSILDWRVIYDVTTWRNDSKYSCFIGGDNPFSVIENPEITDGSSVLLVKESFGNAFAPFLVDHYQYVYVIDFRYYSGHLEDVVDTYGIQDVIFMNNLNSAGGSLQNYLQSFIEPAEETSSQG
ncbi:MAG: hypothetical protein LUE29_02085 [Lachnospiraceae bacterium]|nr:hypothetical protein [Lachnospiraceae bacterium]